MAEIVKIKFQKTYSIPVTNALTAYRVPIAKSDFQTHKFFNELTIINSSVNDITITPDDDSEKDIFVPAKSSQNWSFKNDNMKFSSLLLTENSNAQLAADKVKIIVMKKRIENVGNTGEQ